MISQNYNNYLQHLIIDVNENFQWIKETEDGIIQFFLSPFSFIHSFIHSRLKMKMQKK